MKHLIAPSILTADFLNLGKEIGLVNQSQADWLHMDIMDGVFVPNLTFGFHIIKQVKKVSQKPLDVHLMIINPDRYIEEFREAGADILTVHYESCPHLHRTVQKIKSMGMKTGVALNPHTPVHLLETILPDLDMVLNMTVNPGFGAQSFIEGSYKKIRDLRSLIQRTGSQALIQVDGGVDLTNLHPLVEAGVDVFVVGNTVFSSGDPVDMIRKLKEA